MIKTYGTMPAVNACSELWSMGSWADLDSLLWRPRQRTSDGGIFASAAVSVAGMLMVRGTPEVPPRGRLPV
jgi:hypothetical protein